MSVISRFDVARDPVGHFGHRQVILSLVALLAAAALPFIVSGSFALTIVSQIGVAIIFALSFNLMFGVAGMLWFAHAIFYGAAAYATIYLLRHMEVANAPIWLLPVPVMPLIGAVVGVVAGFLIGGVTTRRDGLAFAMISLGISELVSSLCYIFINLSGGEQGISADRTVGSPVFGWTFGPQLQIYYVILFWCVIVLAFYSFFMRTPLARIALAVRENPVRVEFVGYNVKQLRWIIFTISAGFAGIAGALHALNYEHVGPATLGLEISGLVIFMVVIGGTGGPLGSVIGAALLTFLYSVVGNLTSAWALYVGLVFVLVVMFLPRGIAGFITMHRGIMDANTSAIGRLAVRYVVIGVPSVVIALSSVALIEMAFAWSEATAGTRGEGYFHALSEKFFVSAWLFYPILLGSGLLAWKLLFPWVSAAYIDAIKLVERS